MARPEGIEPPTLSFEDAGRLIAGPQHLCDVARNPLIALID